MQIWVIHPNLYGLGNILITSGIIQRDRYTGECLLQVLWSVISTFVFSTLLSDYTKQKSYFNLQMRVTLQLTNKIKERTLNCMVVC